MMKKLMAVSLAVAGVAVAACGNDVDVNVDTSAPVVDTVGGLVAPVDTSLRRDTTAILYDTVKQGGTKSP